MKTLKLILHASSRVKFQISTDGYPSSDSSLPYTDEHGESKKLDSVLYALDWIPSSKSDRPELDANDDREWMKNEGILSDDGSTFTNNVREIVGKRLYSSIFPGEIRDRLNLDLKELIDHNQEDRDGNRLHISIQYNAALNERCNFSLYPWQLAHDGKEFIARRLACFSHLLVFGEEKSSFTRPKRGRILLISSEATDGKMERIQPKESEIQQSITEVEDNDATCKDRLALANWIGNTKKHTFEALNLYLTTHRNDPECPNIIHFDGHGVFKRRCRNPHCSKLYSRSISRCSDPECNWSLPPPEGFLLFENKLGKPDYRSAKTFAKAIQIIRPVLVVLTVCRSAMAREDKSVFNGIAQELIHHGIPAVIGTQFSLSEKSAAEFSKHFYQTLAIENSLLKAVSQACESIDEKFKELEWYRPIVFMRYEGIEDGKLFDFDQVQIPNSPKEEKDMAVVINFQQHKISKIKGHIDTFRSSVKPLTEAISHQTIITHSKFKDFLQMESIHPSIDELIEFLKTIKYKTLRIMEIIRIKNNLKENSILLTQKSTWFKYNTSSSAEYNDYSDAAREAVEGILNNLKYLDEYLSDIQNNL
ncbi:MAG: CHAT domain-containing protein [Cyanobacteria bacterium P01_H01_bin.15]